MPGEVQSKGTEVILKWVKAVKGEAKYLQCLSILLPLPPGRQACFSCSANRGKLPISVRYLLVDESNGNTLGLTDWELVAEGHRVCFTLLLGQQSRTQKAVPCGTPRPGPHFCWSVFHTAHTSHKAESLIPLLPPSHGGFLSQLDKTALTLSCTMLDTIAFCKGVQHWKNRGAEERNHYSVSSNGYQPNQD